MLSRWNREFLLHEVITFERILYIAVDRSAETLHLPIGGHVNIIPRTDIVPVIKIGRPFVGIFSPMKFPDSIKESHRGLFRCVEGLPKVT